MAGEGLGATVAVLRDDARRVLRRFGLVAAAWTTLLAITAPAVDAPGVLAGGIAVLWAWALASQLVHADAAWWWGWLAAAVATEFLGPTAGTGGWSVAGGATLLVLVAAAGSGRTSTVVTAVVVLSLAALSRGLVSDAWSVGGSVGSVLLFVFAGIALLWLSRVLLRSLAERDALRDEVLAAREQAAGARARAEASAALHDSVLQHLAVVARAEHLDDARRAAARASADLRAFLRAPTAATATLRAAVDAAVRRAADGRDCTIAGAGDHPLDERGHLLAAAAGEAVRNAFRHGAPPVRVYTEVREGTARVWVNDAGPGFVLDDVPVDRLGVRDSIVARLERAGGTARLDCTDGCEWELGVPLG